jgi:hypothetical protein
VDEDVIGLTGRVKGISRERAVKWLTRWVESRLAVERANEKKPKDAPRTFSAWLEPTRPNPSAKKKRAARKLGDGSI